MGSSGEDWEEHVRRYGEPGSTFIQWKGTTVCMDLRCLCSAHLHLDIDFAYAVRCPFCKRVLRLGTEVAVLEDPGYDGVLVIEEFTSTTAPDSVDD